MLKIRLLDIQKHRNETTFRPYLQNSGLFRDVGIQFVMQGDCDMTWVAHASFAQRSELYHKAFYSKLWERQLTSDDYIFFDGQDSPSLYGAYQPFVDKNPLLLMKNSLYVDRSVYETDLVHGRLWWGNAESNGSSSDYNYKIDNPDFSKIKLSGTNWLSTVNPHWYDYKNIKKDIDVFAMFSYPAKENIEFGVYTHQFYDNFRRPCVDQINQLPSTVTVAKLEDGQKVPIEKYYELMSRSKIVIAPFGYGEMAPRDIEAAMFGGILIKPDMGHIESIPNPYIPEETYRPIEWGFADMNDVILDTLERFNYYQEKFVNNMRNEYMKQYAPEKMVMHIYDIISNLKGYGTV